MIKVTVDFGNDGFKIDATVTKDGNKWCCLAGEDLQVGMAGFGHTVQAAIADFQCNIRNIH